MFDMENLVSILDMTLDSQRKRHIVGGLLLSVSFLFGGLAITVMTINDDKKKKERDEDIEE